MEKPMRTKTMALTALAFSIAATLGSVLGCAEEKAAEAENQVTAIDILLEPDATMIKQAEAANERLLKSYPKGFALDKTHQPHISILQRYVKTADLDKVYEAVGKVLAEEADRLEAEGVQILLHPLEGSANCMDRDRADGRPHQVPKETDRRRRPVHREDGDRGGVRHHEGRPGHQSTDDRLRGELRAE